ncbi:uncharacterized protein LOC134683842 [Mytilus trossulus]|uniref:uncharacterized protein LOC134683842 n=1 Tax=Mytilus trossulus TaxID=6551 RepID=UPI00300567F0
MLNGQQNVHTNSRFPSNIANPEYEEVRVEYNPTEYEEVIAEHHPTEYRGVVEEYHSTDYEEVVADYHPTENEEVVAEHHPLEYEELVEEYHSTDYEEMVVEHHSTVYGEMVGEYHSTENEEVVVEQHSTEYEELVAEYHSTVYEEVVADYHATENEEVDADHYPTEYEDVVAEHHPLEYEELVVEYHSTVYEEVVAEYHSTQYDEAHSEQRADTPNPVHIALSNLPLRHQRIHIPLWLLSLIIICSLIAIVLTGVVTFLVRRGTLPKTKCPDAEETNCYLSSWSSWYKCSVTCGIGVQIRIKQQMNNTNLCSKNETFDNKTCYRGECTGESDAFDMKFSRTALHANVFISADNTIISNVPTIDTSNSPDAQFQNYRGTIADICVGDKELIYYEVNYTYTIVKPITAYALVLEVGLAERSKVDRSVYVGNENVSGWSFHLATDSTVKSVNLYSRKADYHKVWESFSNDTVGTKVHGRFKLFINRRRNHFALRHDGSIFHVFNNVTSSAKLCPVFAVYAPNSVHVKLQLMNPRNFTYYPW